MPFTHDSAGPLDKLDALLEDIFEAEDALSPDGDTSELSADFFSPLSTDCAHPFLHPTIVKKLTTHITKCTRSGKRSRQNTRDSSRTTSGTPRAKVGVSDLDTAALARVLRLLERSVKSGEDLDPFHTLHFVDSQPRSPSKKSAKKKSKADDRRSTSRTPHPIENGEGEDENGNSPPPGGPSEVELDELSKLLHIARDSVYAADCCISLLSSDRLTKQVRITSTYNSWLNILIHSSSSCIPRS